MSEPRVAWTEARFVWMVVAVWLMLATINWTVSIVWTAYALGWYHARWCR